MEFFLLDDKNVFLKNKKLLNKNIFKIVDEVSSSESNVRKTRSRVAKISSFPTPMVHQKIIISSTKETDNCEAKSSYQLRHKKQSKPEEKKSESHLQGDIQDKSRNEIGIDIFWHAFFYSGLFGLSLYWLLWGYAFNYLLLFLDYTVFNITTYVTKTDFLPNCSFFSSKTFLFENSMIMVIFFFESQKLITYKSTTHFQLHSNVLSEPYLVKMINNKIFNLFVCFYILFH